MTRFEHVRPGWNELDSRARYFFQTLPWIELITKRGQADIRWNVTTHGDRTLFVSIAQQRLISFGALRLRILTSVRPVLQGPPLADGLLAVDAGARLHFSDLARGFEPWHALVFRGLRVGSPWLTVARHNVDIVAEPEGGAGIFETDEAFAERWHRVPKNMRNAIRKARNKIGTRGEFVIAAGEAKANAFEAFVELEAAGWKGAEATALAHRPLERELLRTFLMTSESAGVRSLYIDGRLAAAQLTIVVAGTLFLLKIAYDEASADLSPSNVLLAHLIETCCADAEIARIDCLVWAPWHERWGMAREPTYKLTAFNAKSIVGRLATVAWWSRNKLREARNR